MKIRVQGDTVLGKVAKPVVQFDEKLEKLARRMLATMYDANGIGLAAPQVGKLVRLVVIDLKPKENVADTAVLNGRSLPTVLLFPLIAVNPTFIPVGTEKEFQSEGCLSVPDKCGLVERFLRIRVRYQDLAGEWNEVECSGLLARCFQHEIDHLEGILFITKAKAIKDRIRKKNSVSGDKAKVFS
ncbi:MAG: peptide deformylase [Puniceicoccales bacterium]|jgi:peptide deformylase|nr:peptide deformylase [Puniceicoccales bacterium]